MAIPWSNAQRRTVGSALDKHPVDSGRCVEAAKLILPSALENDPDSEIWELWPAEGQFVLPRRSIGARWYFHATLETQDHYVDALTGVDGTPRVSYLNEHWQESDALRWIRGSEEVSDDESE